MPRCQSRSSKCRWGWPMEGPSMTSGCRYALFNGEVAQLFWRLGGPKNLVSILQSLMINSSKGIKKGFARGMFIVYRFIWIYKGYTNKLSVALFLLAWSSGERWTGLSLKVLGNEICGGNLLVQWAIPRALPENQMEWNLVNLVFECGFHTLVFGISESEHFTQAL